MYNLRYHIASLVGVFLALALGLVLGGLVVERGTLDAQREALVTGLQRDFERLSDENETLSTRLDAQSSFAAAAADVAMAGRLDGRTVVVLANSGRSDELQDVRTAIDKAGGTTAIVYVEKPGLGLDDEGVRDALGSLVATDTDTPAASVATSIAAEWVDSGTERPLTDALVESGALRLEEFGADVVPDALVVLATVDGSPDESLIQLGQAFQGAGGVALGAEPLSAPNGVALTAADRGLGAVNTVELPSGAWSLVYLAGGAEPAFYGVGEGVDAPFPPLPPAQAEAAAGVSALSSRAAPFDAASSR